MLISIPETNKILQIKLHFNKKKLRAFLVPQKVKNLPAMRETLVQSLGWEDPLKKAMATHFSILAWRIPWTEESHRLESTG